MPRPAITKADILADFLRVEKLCPGFSMGEYSLLGAYSIKAVVNHCLSFNGVKRELGIPLRRSGRLKAERESRRDRFKPEPEEDLSGMRRCLNGGEMFLSPDRRAVQNCDQHRRTGPEVIFYGFGR